MPTIGVYNDNTSYISDDNNKFIKFEGDIDLMTSEAETNTLMESYSTTKSIDANKSLSIIKNHVDKKSLMIDATACIGGDFLQYCRYFKYNIGVEINKQRYDKLYNKILTLKNIVEDKNDKNNINKFTFYDKKITIINSSFNNVYPKIFETYNKLPVKNIGLFIDPPWGGKEYKNYDKIILGLGGESLLSIINNIKKIASNKKIHFFLKLPTNFYLELFKNLNYQVYHINKFILVHIY